jgi:hypothetical protein
VQEKEGMLDKTIVVIREEGARQLVPQWNQGMIAASIAVSLLGAFTSTQLFVCRSIAVFTTLSVPILTFSQHVPSQSLP